MGGRLSVRPSPVIKMAIIPSFRLFLGCPHVVPFQTVSRMPPCRAEHLDGTVITGLGWGCTNPIDSTDTRTCSVGPVQATHENSTINLYHCTPDLRRSDFKQDLVSHFLPYPYFLIAAGRTLDSL